MHTQKRKSFWLITACGILAVLAGVALGRLDALAAGLIAIGFAASRLRSGGRLASQPAAGEPSHTAETSPKVENAVDADSIREVDELFSAAVDSDRYAVLLRRGMAGSLDEDLLEAAEAALQRDMTVVPQGAVRLGQRVAVTEQVVADEQGDCGYANREETEKQIEAFYVGRYAVTNRQFQQFVDAGGYEQMEHWPREVWPALLDFVDSTGQPGPRFWRDGRYPDGKDDHPVVGVCWYEAVAYCHWAGKRLPTDAAWVKASSWPVAVGAGNLEQRRYPWGDTMDASQANLWCAGIGDTVPVNAFAPGVSVGGCYQMIGNVWEWMHDDVGQAVETAMIAGGDLVLPAPMKSVRGGAFDTYFDSQATCHYRSADRPTARKRNIGFRCVLSVSDVDRSRVDGCEPSASSTLAAPTENLEDTCVSEEMTV